MKKYLLKAIRKKQNKGMTIVEVMVGFVILSIVLASLSGTIAFCNNMMMNAVDLDKMQQNFQKVLCQDNTTTQLPGVSLQMKVIKGNYNMIDDTVNLEHATLYETTKDYDSQSGSTYTLKAYTIK